MYLFLVGSSTSIRPQVRKTTMYKYLDFGTVGCRHDFVNGIHGIHVLNAGASSKDLWNTPEHVSHHQDRDTLRVAQGMAGNWRDGT